MEAERKHGPAYYPEKLPEHKCYKDMENMTAEEVVKALHDN